MEKYQKAISKIFEKIKPKAIEKKKVQLVTKLVLKEIRKNLKKFNALDAMVVGSFSRETWLPEKKEIDIFVLFPKEMSKEEIKKKGIELGIEVIRKLKGKYVIEYAEHPYVRGFIKGIQVDIVPCFKVESGEKIKSSVDRTPFHVEFLKNYYPSKLSDQVRITKKFMKAIGVYGADAKTQGFSGYSVELLIIKYKTFVNLLKASLDWEPGEIIQIKQFYKKEDFPMLRKKFKNQPLILIDPVDKNRNTLAALSPYNFFKFKKYAKMFLENPKEEFFYERKVKPISPKEFEKILKERKTKIIGIKFSCPKVVPDILYPQLRRFIQRIESYLEEKPSSFKVFSKGFFTDEKKIVLCIFELEYDELPRLEKRIGPSIFQKKRVEKFLAKYEDGAVYGPYVQKENWVVEIERKFNNAKEKLYEFLSKDKEELLANGIPSYIAEEISKEFEILDKQKIKNCLKRKDVGKFFREFFEKEKLV